MNSVLQPRQEAERGFTQPGRDLTDTLPMVRLNVGRP